MDNTFRQRSASALMHPATLAALAVLLVNDIVFKALWPGAWIPGKLSDLAWMVFAPPLLVFLLSFVAGKHTALQRAMFLTAYAGLPLLYAAFNTFPPVHNGILRGISFVSGGTAGAPLDATDSIVIPLALSIAAWVWRAPVASPESLRLRWGLLAAAVASLASIATSYGVPQTGITEVGIAEDDTVLVSAFFGESYYTGSYRTDDGGTTWISESRFNYESTGRAQSAQAPSGTYTIDGPDILLRHSNGEEEVAYSAGYLRQGANVWVQEHATTHLGIREAATGPYGIVYDGRSGNVIAAVGIQGVLVGTRDGQWTRVSVAQFMPTDFSLSGKTRLLLSNYVFWAAALAIALAMTGYALLASQSRTRGALEMLVAMPAAVASVSLVLVFGGSDAAPESNYGIEVMLGVLALPLGFGLMAACWRQLKHWRVVVPAFLSMNTLVVLNFMLWLHLGIPLILAKVSTIVLTALVAVVLVGYINRLQQPQ